MGYSAGKYRKEPEKRPWAVHPVWRGIGCFLILLVPIMAWAGTIVFLSSSASSMIPDTLIKPVYFQMTQTGWINQVLVWLNTNLGGRGLTYAHLLIWLVFVLIGSVIMIILYGMAYRVVGPPRYGPLDAPPIKKGRRR